ncbi:TapB family protein [Mucilaginibacter xinganensis]|uniref:DUF3108 domain-containing protein n=1 Tax=Mucilaginibacter xinganensis TaxID=1234841 RepID=A0A223P0S2_9SPHI|nr:hypothetical protein [Mucilaginibacter xinganensis]ASU35428.1 hypothetical protein MuYL_3543 [Mucilaginibacter xinganensis]
MKKLIITMVSLVTVLTIGYAQTCDQFINSGNGKKFVYANLDAKGNNQGSVSYSSVKKDASTLTYHNEVADKNGKTIGTGDFDMTCSGTAIKIDMKSFIPASSSKQFSNMQFEGDGKYLTYPLNLKVGDKLEDGSAVISVMNNGSKFSEMQINMTKRTVENSETVKTDAGTFDCFKITYDSYFKAKIMGIGIPINMKVIEWFAPKLGRFVKSETYRKEKLAGSMVLQSVN